jgi:SSS family solute:Na+ symporter
LFVIKTLHAWTAALIGWIPPFFYETPFMMMAFYMLCACVAAQVGLSLLLPKLPHEDRERLYWANPLDALKSAGWPGLGDYRILAALVVVVMVGLYTVFR